MESPEVRTLGNFGKISVFPTVAEATSTEVVRSFCYYATIPRYQCFVFACSSLCACSTQNRRMSGIEVKNTLCFDFENGSARPTLDEIADFVKTLEADAAEMEACYRVSDEKAIYIKFKSENSMLYALRHNSDKLNFKYADGQIKEVAMSLAGGNVQYVRVYGLHPEIPDSTLALVFGKYGKVKRVVREKFPAELGLIMHTGVRGVYMDVQKEIPSSLYFLNRKGNIFYEGNKSLCFLCKMEGHRMNSCPNRKARKQAKEQAKGSQQEEQRQQQQQDEEQSGTYAGVVAGSSLDGTSEEPAVEVEIVEEEVLHMDVSSQEAETSSKTEASDLQAQKPPVFKHRNDAYYFYKFGIVDYTEKRRIEEEEEAKREAERLEEERRLYRKQQAELKLKSPPRKNKKN